MKKGIPIKLQPHKTETRLKAEKKYNEMITRKKITSFHKYTSKRTINLFETHWQKESTRTTRKYEIKN